MLAAFLRSDELLAAALGRRALPRWLPPTLGGLSAVGDGLHLVGAVALLIAAGPGCRAPLAAVLLAAVLGNALVLLLKWSFPRPRPSAGCPNLLFRAVGLDRVALDPHSFPSGHSVNAFALATVLGLFNPAWAPLLLTLAAGVALSRLLLRLHFASDVLLGSLLGTLVGAASFAMVAR